MKDIKFLREYLDLYIKLIKQADNHNLHTKIRCGTAYVDASMLIDYIRNDYDFEMFYINFEMFGKKYTYNTCENIDSNIKEKIISEMKASLK